MLYNESLTGVQNILSVCGLNFVPETHNEKMVVYFIHEKHLTKENCQAFHNITNEEICHILSSINVNNPIDYNHVLCFIFNRILKLNYRHSRFAIPGIYDGKPCYLVFYVKQNVISCVIQYVDLKN